MHKRLLYTVERTPTEMCGPVLLKADGKKCVKI